MGGNNGFFSIRDIEKNLRRQGVKFLDAGDVAQFLHVEKVSVYRWIHEGKLNPSNLNGKYIVFNEMEVRQLLREVYGDDFIVEEYGIGFLKQLQREEGILRNRANRAAAKKDN